MSLKKMFELAGVDITKGKAKELVESEQDPSTLIKSALRKAFGHIYFEKRSSGLKITIDANHPDHTQFEKAIRKAVEETGVKVSGVAIHDDNRATIKFGD